jgi:hypothetical protein
MKLVRNCLSNPLDSPPLYLSQYSSDIVMAYTRIFEVATTAASIMATFLVINCKPTTLLDTKSRYCRREKGLVLNASSNRLAVLRHDGLPLSE